MITHLTGENLPQWIDTARSNLNVLVSGLVWGRSGVFMPVGVMIVGVDRPSFA